MRLPSASTGRPVASRAKWLVRMIVLLAAAAILAALGSLFGIAYDYGYLRTSILTGVEGGNYHGLATRLAARAKRQHGSLAVVPTAGSIENVDRLVAGQESCTTKFALVQDGTPAPAEARLEMLGRLPETESLILLTRRGRSFDSFGDLRGVSIGIGPVGSGTGFLIRELFEDPDLRELGVRLSNHDLSKQAKLVADGGLDLAAMVVQEDAALLRQIIQKYDLDIAAPRNFDGLLARHPWLSRGHIEAGRFDLVRPTPAVGKSVARVDTFVIASPCAKRAERVAMLLLLSEELPAFVRANPPRATGSATALRLAPEARQFFLTGEPELADRYFPWLVNLMSPAYWVYLVMAATILFNLMNGYSRFRLWRIDAAREKLQKRLETLTGPGLTHAQMRMLPPSALSGSDRSSAEALLGQFDELRCRCQRQVSSICTPMGDEIYYRYQEALIAEATTTLGTLLDRKAPAH